MASQKEGLISTSHWPERRNTATKATREAWEASLASESAPEMVWVARRVRTRGWELISGGGQLPSSPSLSAAVSFETLVLWDTVPVSSVAQVPGTLPIEFSHQRPVWVPDQQDGRVEHLNLSPATLVGLHADGAPAPPVVLLALEPCSGERRGPLEEGIVGSPLPWQQTSLSPNPHP